MAKEEFFVIAEDETNEMEKELISVAEGEWLNENFVSDAPYVEEYDEELYNENQEAEDENWLSSGEPKHFQQFLEGEMRRFLKPADVRGNVTKIEQALGQWKQLDSYISKAIRGDYHGIINVDFVDKMRVFVEQTIDQLEDMLDGIQTLKKNRKQMKRRHKRGEEEVDDIVKEGSAPNFAGIQINISAFERAIVGALINGKVSGGRNLEELYAIAKDKYKFDDRQELAIFQILADLGYPTFKDRLRIDKDPDDPTRTDDFGEWQSNYYA